MKPASFNYEDVVKVCNELQKQGIRPTVKAVRAELGGSNSTILSYLHQWQESERVKSEGQGIDFLSKELKDMINAELFQYAKKCKTEIQEELTQIQDREQEARKLLKEAEEAKITFSKNIADLENELLTHKNLLATTKDELNIVKRELENERKSSENARIGAAEIKSKLKEFDRVLRENEALKKANIELEIKMAVIEAKSETVLSENKKLYETFIKKKELSHI